MSPDALDVVSRVSRDLNYALRALRRTPGFTAVAVLTLALGVGATTAIFTVVHSVLLKPLAYPAADRLVRLIENVPASENRDGRPRRRTAFGRAELAALRQRAHMLSHVSGQSFGILTLTGHAAASRVQAAVVSPELFPMLGARPLVGRAFNAGEDAVIILSHGLWQRHFGADPNVAGRIVHLHGILPRAEVKPYTIVGVLPAAFQFPEPATDLWMPIDAGGRGASPILGRLGDGVSAGTAAAEAATILFGVRGHSEAAAQAQASMPPRFEFVGVQDDLVAPVRPALLVLMAAVGFVLLIACVNVANLLLARTAARRREVAIRVALGAGRGRLIRHLLTESVLLALIGGAAGTAIAFGGVRLLRVLATTLTRIDLGIGVAFPRIDEIEVDGAVLAFTFLVSASTAIVCGLAPAIRHSRPSGFDLRRPGRLRGALVVAEISLSMMLLVGGALLTHSFVRLARVDPGYDPAHVMTFQIALPSDRYPAARLKTFAEDVVARLRAVPGVEAAAYANQLPMVSLRDTAGGLRRTPDPAAAPSPDGPDARFVSQEYLDVMGIRVIAGRGLSESDGAGRPRVIVINQSLARRDFSGENPIGQTVYIGRLPHPWRIVGIVDDVRQFRLDRPPEPQFFADMRQWPETGLLLFPVGAYYAVRTAGDAAAKVANLRRVVSVLDAEAGVFNVASMEQLVATTISRPRMYAVLVGIFAGVGLVLASVGIYGVMAYSVSQRTREIGIRMALGAPRFAVMGLVLGQGLALTVIGIGLGVAGAAALTTYLEGMLFGLTPLDPATFVAVSILFAAIAAFASYVPARRAATVEPSIALRCE